MIKLNDVMDVHSNPPDQNIMGKHIATCFPRKEHYPDLFSAGISEFTNVRDLD